MSSRQLEEKAERDQALAVAKALGVTIQELNDLEWSIEPCESDDGVPYGNNITFGEGSDPAILKKIPGAIEQGWVRVGSLD